MATNDAGPAFPTYHARDDFTDPGMSLLDWFAGQFAAAELASAGANDEAAAALMEAAEKAGMTLEQRIAHNAYRLADAMIAEREKPVEPIDE